MLTGFNSPADSGSQLKVGNLPGQRQVARAVAVMPVAPPRQQKRGNFHELIMLLPRRVEHSRFAVRMNGDFESGTRIQNHRLHLVKIFDVTFFVV